MLKLSSISEGLDQIEKIDNDIAAMIEAEDYSQIIEILKKRLTIISQITGIKKNEGISKEAQARLMQIFSDSNNIQKKVKEKKDKISARLNKRRTIVKQNKRFGY